MQSWLKRMYERHGARYLLGVIGLVFAQDLLLVVPSSLFVAARFENLSAAEYATALAIIEPLVVIGVSVAAFAVRGALRPGLAWLRGDRDPASAPAVALAVQVAPRRASLLGGGVFLLFVAPASTLAIVLPVDRLSVVDGIAIYGGQLFTILFASVLNWFSLELAMRPFLTDLATSNPAANRLQGSPRSLAVKLFVGLVSTTATTGVFAAGFAAKPGLGGAGLLRAFGISLGVSVALVLGLVLVLALLVLDPIRDLTRAAQIVGGGDLDTRVSVTSNDELGVLAESFNDMVSGLRERAVLHDALGSYVAPDVARRVLVEGAFLKGREVEASVLFADIRDFTAFAEQTTAEGVVSHLNEFFELAVPLLSGFGAHVNKYIGDGLLAAFGIPDPVPDHADRALLAACELVEATRRAFGGKLRIGVGINSGGVIAGTVGGGGKLEYTLIGDTVNVAARVEQLTKELHQPVLITEDTRSRLIELSAELDPQGEISVKGKASPVSIYAPRQFQPDPA
jgi:adenylate cyclase